MEDSCGGGEQGTGSLYPPPESWLRDWQSGMNAVIAAVRELGSNVLGFVHADCRAIDNDAGPPRRAIRDEAVLA